MYNNLTGKVVGKSTLMGGIPGYDPHKPAKVNIIDGGESFSVDLSHVTPDDMDKAMKAANMSIDNQESMVNVFKMLPDKSVERPGFVSTIGSSFDHTLPGSRSQLLIDEGPARIEPVRVANHETVRPPTKKVVFDIGELGQIESCYHDVVFENNILVLAYDTSYTSGTKFMPLRTNSPIRVTVPHLDKSLEVISAGIRFTVQNLDICVLLVEGCA